MAQMPPTAAAPIQVWARLRPSVDASRAGDAGGADQCGVLQVHPQTSTVTVPARLASQSHRTLDHAAEAWDFPVDGLLLPTASQDEVFERTAAPLVRSLVDGINGAMLAYGQTGAGKTHTMFGPGGDYRQRGIIARTVTQVFRQLAKVRGGSGGGGGGARVHLSALEIYNEQLVDMFNVPDVADRPRWDSVGKAGPGDGAALPNTRGEELIVADDRHGATFVRNLTVVPVENEEQALDLLFEAEMNRSIASHQINQRSSRSHFVMTVFVTHHDEDGALVRSKLHLVDLAGSERTDRTGSHGRVAREAGYINKSLSFLEQVVIALPEADSGDKRRDHIPYRRSKLTHLLKDSIGGNCQTLLLACVWPAAEHLEQTLGTLKFATRMKRIENTPVVNKSQADTADSLIVQRLQHQVNLPLQKVFHCLSFLCESPAAKSVPFLERVEPGPQRVGP